MSGKCRPTLSVARSEAWVHKGFVYSLDGEDTSEIRVDVRENGHDCGPDQSTMIVLRSLYGIVQSHGRREPWKVTYVELDIRSAPTGLF